MKNLVSISEHFGPIIVTCNSVESTLIQSPSLFTKSSTANFSNPVIVPSVFSLAAALPLSQAIPFSNSSSISHSNLVNISSSKCSINSGSNSSLNYSNSDSCNLSSINNNISSSPNSYDPLMTELQFPEISKHNLGTIPSFEYQETIANIPSTCVFYNKQNIVTSVISKPHLATYNILARNSSDCANNSQLSITRDNNLTFATQTPIVSSKINNIHDPSSYEKNITRKTLTENHIICNDIEFSQHSDAISNNNCYAKSDAIHEKIRSHESLPTSLPSKQSLFENYETMLHLNVDSEFGFEHSKLYLNSTGETIKVECLTENLDTVNDSTKHSGMLFGTIDLPKLASPVDESIAINEPNKFCVNTEISCQNHIDVASIPSLNNPRLESSNVPSEDQRTKSMDVLSCNDLNHSATVDDSLYKYETCHNIKNLSKHQNIYIPVSKSTVIYSPEYSNYVSTRPTDNDLPSQQTCNNSKLPFICDQQKMQGICKVTSTNARLPLSDSERTTLSGGVVNDLSKSSKSGIQWNAIDRSSNNNTIYLPSNNVSYEGHDKSNISSLPFADDSSDVDIERFSPSQDIFSSTNENVIISECGVMPLLRNQQVSKQANPSTVKILKQSRIPLSTSESHRHSVTSANASGDLDNDRLNNIPVTYNSSKLFSSSSVLARSECPSPSLHDLRASPFKTILTVPSLATLTSRLYLPPYTVTATSSQPPSDTPITIATSTYSSSTDTPYPSCTTTPTHICLSTGTTITTSIHPSTNTTSDTCVHLSSGTPSTTACIHPYTTITNTTTTTITSPTKTPITQCQPLNLQLLHQRACKYRLVPDCCFSVCQVIKNMVCLQFS